MKLKSLIYFAAAGLMTGCCGQPCTADLVPAPESVELKDCSVRVAKTLTVYAGDKSLADLPEVYGASLQKVYSAGVDSLETGFKRIVSDTKLPTIAQAEESKAFVKLGICDELAEEEYSLNIDKKGVNICGGSDKGVWWGLQTLTELLVQNGGSALPCLEIKDKPAFAYRGAHFDAGRHFFPVQDVKKFIDIMVMHKLNVLHWHLTEDQGWRIEIKKYPLLTEKGSIRAESPVGHYREDGLQEYDGTPYGGFYTQEDVKEVVKYATERRIMVIPEIEMPGHSVAVLACYPELGCVGQGYEVRKDWGISDDVLCIGKEKTFEFLENVLDEVCELFPSEYIHIGGDEAPHVRWENCPDCKKLMKKEGITDPRKLQGYLVKRIEEYLATKGRKLIGWDEILDAGVTPSSIVMSWRGTEGGVTAAKQGNHVIMSPNSYFYLDYYQTPDPEANAEPLAIGGCLPLEKCYSFDPYEGLDENEKSCIWGVQANTWTEYIANFDYFQHMDLPRFAALSEVSWSAQKGSYEDFLGRVKAAVVPMYQYYGYIYATYALGE